MQRGKLARQAASKKARNATALGCLPPGVFDTLHSLERFLPGYLHPRYEVLANQEEDFVSGMAKMSRLSTDLANERTLLAWVRTILAIMRTVFATLGLQGVGWLWVVVSYVAVVNMTVLMVLATGIGLWRYTKIAHIVNLKSIPQHFGRASITPLNVMVGVSVGTVTIAALFKGFE